jgi:hypothetical protein
MRVLEIHRDGDVYSFYSPEKDKVILRTNSERRMNEWSLYYKRKKRVKTVIRKF